MILRIWNGWTTSDDADPYQRLLDEEIVPGIVTRDISGLRNVDILRRLDELNAVSLDAIHEAEGWS